MPPKPGDILDLDVTALAYGGRGIARHDDFVVFVRGALPGDRVRAKITKRKQRHAEARTVELLRPSSERVPERCRHAAECGGCGWQALTYARQLEVKQLQVVDALTRLGDLDGFALEPILGMDDPWRYRNKMEFSFGADESGLVLGLHRRGSWREIVEIEDCLLASERMNAARAAVAEASRELGLAPYDRGREGGGLLRHLVIREGRASGDLLLNLYVHHRFPEERALAEAVAARCEPTSFGLTVNATPADAAVGDGPHMLHGPPSLRERLAGIALEVPATAFLQTNTTMTDRLYETAAGFAALAPDQRAVDLYCGIGSFSLRLAADAAHVTGIELQAEAVSAARVNAALNGAAHVAFFAGDVRRLLKDPSAVKLDPESAPPAVVVVDPPRAGLSRKALQRAAALGAPRFVYISCNPTTLAGNGAELADLGYRLTRVQPVDMFPHTHHVETVALFERSDG